MFSAKQTSIREEYIMAVKSKNKKNKDLKGGPLNLLPGEQIKSGNGVTWKRKASR
jgi:hypothetical protein